MLRIRFEAHFSAFRNFTVGSFRPTADFITYTAAYGLLLNAAGVEMRHYDPAKAMTLIRKDLPEVRIALGAVSFPERNTIYQQLHRYPVGSEAGKKFKPGARGNKYHIDTARREILTGLKAYICTDGNPGLEEKVRAGLEGRSARSYGLPFAGDNNFLPDRFEPLDGPAPAHWYVLAKDETPGLSMDQITRLTTFIDRENMSLTRSDLFAPTKEAVAEIPDHAWVTVRY